MLERAQVVFVVDPLALSPEATDPRTLPILEEPVVLHGPIRTHRFNGVLADDTHVYEEVADADDVLFLAVVERLAVASGGEF